MLGISLQIIDPDLFFPIHQGTLLWQQILGKIGELTFIQHVGFLEWIRISQFRFTGIKWQYISYILCNVDEDRSSNPGKEKL